MMKIDIRMVRPATDRICSQDRSVWRLRLDRWKPSRTQSEERESRRATDRLRRPRVVPCSMRAISPAASLRGLSIQIGRTSEALCHTWLELDRRVRTPPVCGCYRKSLVVASPNEVQPAGSFSSFVGSSPGHKQTETSLSN